MPNRTSGHLRNNIVGYAALFIALSGTAYAVDGPLAGQNQVGSADIINGDVRSDDLGAAQVTAAKLAANSVNAGKIADGEVGAAEVGQGAVGTGEVANDSLSGGDVANGSLTSLDLAKRTVQRDDLAFEIDDALTARVTAGGDRLGGDATSVEKRGEGVYDVHFGGRGIGRCAPQATVMAGPGTRPNNGEISVEYYVPSSSFDYVTVYTWDSTSFGGAPPAASDRPFSLTVEC